MQALRDRVSVVIPAYHAGPFIGRAVRSVMEQTWEAQEIVIVADDGTDYRRLLAESDRSDSRVRCLSTGGVGTGPANARNAGLDAAQGRVVATLDADDMLEPTALETLVPLALEHGAACCRPGFIDQVTGAELQSFDRPLPSGPVALEELLTSHLHTYAGIVFDRNQVTARWPEWGELWEDVYFHVRCFDDLDALYHVNEPLYRYYRVPGSLCNRAETGREHLLSAGRLAGRLLNGDTLGLRKAASRELFRRYLQSRQAIEMVYLQALADGSCRDFHAFMGNNLDLFYTLDVAGDSGQGSSRLEALPPVG